MLIVLTTHPIQYQAPLWRALARDGRVPFEVWYLSDRGVRPSEDPEFGTRFAWDIDLLSGYRHRFLPGAGRSPPDSFWRCRLREPLTARLRERGATALWLQGWQVAAYWQTARQARAAGVEVWLRGESNDLAPVPAWKRPLKRIALRYMFGQVTRFLTVGAANRRLYESYDIAPERLFPAPYAVDSARFARQAEDLRPQRRTLRRQWGIAEDAFCVLFCGKLIAKKRPLDLVRAASHLAHAKPDLKLHLLFAGSGAMEPELRAACDAAGAARPHASFTGFLNQTEISRAYVAADALVLPSGPGETWGLAVNEALASGLPCIVSDACGCAEEFAGSPAVATFPMGDSAALAGRIADLAAHPVGGEACARAVAGHSFAVTVETVAALHGGRAAAS